MTNVLWLSRHDMTNEQLEGLKKVAIEGGFKDSELNIKKVDMTVKSADDVIEAGEGCDIFAVVLPPNLLSDLFAKTDKKIVTAKNKRVLVKSPDGKESKVTFVYDGWEIVDEFIYKSHIIK